MFVEGEVLTGLTLANGRVYFISPKLFEVSLYLQGEDEGWVMLNVEFLIKIGGDLTGMEGLCCPWLLPLMLTLM